MWLIPYDRIQIPLEVGIDGFLEALEGETTRRVSDYSVVYTSHRFQGNLWDDGFSIRLNKRQFTPYSPLVDGILARQNGRPILAVRIHPEYLALAIVAFVYATACTFAFRAKYPWLILGFLLVLHLGFYFSYTSERKLITSVLADMAKGDE